MERPIQRRKRAGITLIELLITIGLMVLLAAAVTSAFVAGLDTERRQNRLRSEQNQTQLMEQRITQLLQGAKLSDNTQDRSTYFIGDNVGDSLGPLPGGAASLSTNQNQPLTQPSLSDSSSSEDLGCTRLTFTTNASDVPMRARTSTDDFETQHKSFGPMGGMAEVQYATTPVGEAGDKTGLFERLQRPSDGDPSQGGTESLLSNQVKQIGFQFWNGSSWVTVWDTTGTNTSTTGTAGATTTTSTSQRRLPSAVQVSYILDNDSQNIVHRFIVPIPASDVTPQNPVANGGSS